MKQVEWKWPLGVIGFVIAAAIFLHYQPHKSGDVAAWVQAAASVVAIAWSGWSSRRLQLDVRRDQRLAAAESIFEIAHGSFMFSRYVVDQLGAPEIMRDVREAKRHFDYAQLQELERIAAAIPLHGLETPGLVKLIIILGATIRQMREVVSLALSMDRPMDEGERSEFTITLTQMRNRCDETQRDIGEIVELIRSGRG
ncbi:hypothetical protein [Paraburkholderia agricolaris]|uniref:hypothetical protein n=1 Tax=Paraburkholderia agricolaris TaxID=2152888 RepID=UPI0012911A69|nr:hypothetical protein [Paraburkholderia agricolaris]